MAVAGSTTRVRSAGLGAGDVRALAADDPRAERTDRRRGRGRAGRLGLRLAPRRRHRRARPRRPPATAPKLGTSPTSSPASTSPPPPASTKPAPRSPAAPPKATPPAGSPPPSARPASPPAPAAAPLAQPRRLPRVLPRHLPRQRPRRRRHPPVDGPKTADIGGLSAHQHVAAAEAIGREFGTARGLVREAGDPASGLDSAAGWAVRPFALRPLYPAARTNPPAPASTRHPLRHHPRRRLEGGEDPWTAPTAWSAWALAALSPARRKGPRTNLPALVSETTPRRPRPPLELLADLRRAVDPRRRPPRAGRRPHRHPDLDHPPALVERLHRPRAARTLALTNPLILSAHRATRSAGRSGDAPAVSELRRLRRRPSPSPLTTKLAAARRRFAEQALDQLGVAPGRRSRGSSHSSKSISKGTTRSRSGSRPARSPIAARRDGVRQAQCEGSRRRSICSCQAAASPSSSVTWSATTT